MTIARIVISNLPVNILKVLQIAGGCTVRLGRRIHPASHAEPEHHDQACAHKQQPAQYKHMSSARGIRQARKPRHAKASACNS